MSPPNVNTMNVNETRGLTKRREARGEPVGSEGMDRPRPKRLLTDHEAKLCADALKAAAGVHDDEAWELAGRLDP